MESAGGMRRAGEDPLLEEVRRRLLAALDPPPDRIVAFGSRARGDARTDSDLDLIVVLRGGGSPGQRGVLVRRPLRDLDVAMDILVYTPEEYARYRTYPSSVVRIAEREGIVLHG
jgi:predicted nucleotidyltransferase